MSAKSRVIPYIEDEVHRQGYDRGTALWAQRVEWMWEAWAYAIERRLQPFSVDNIKRVGYLIEREKNSEHDFRQVGVRVGDRVCPPWSEVPRQMEFLVEAQSRLDADVLYYAFEQVHPFVDGNGRTGKILFNWRKGSLREPVLPPNFWSVSNL